MVEVVEVRYDAGRFGAGYKGRPKSPASIRAIPLPEQARDAICEGLVGCPSDGRISAGPGGNQHARRGERTALSVNNYRRVYKRAVASATGLDHLAAVEERLAVALEVSQVALRRRTRASIERRGYLRTR